MRVLILRPEPGNAATADAVRAMGHEAVQLPLFELKGQAWPPPHPSRFDAAVMTSASAARFGGPNLTLYTHLPLFAVGEATARQARTVGFSRITTGPSNAEGLRPFLRGLRLVHFAGEDHKPLPADGPVETVITYTARERQDVGKLPVADTVLVHSPRVGARLAAFESRREGISIVAISEAAAEACGAGWTAVHVAEAPREASLLECLAALCEARVQ